MPTNRAAKVSILKAPKNIQLTIQSYGTPSQYSSFPPEKYAEKQHSFLEVQSVLFDYNDTVCNMLAFCPNVTGLKFLSNICFGKSSTSGRLVFNCIRLSEILGRCKLLHVKDKHIELLTEALPAIRRKLLTYKLGLILQIQTYNFLMSLYFTSYFI